MNDFNNNNNSYNDDSIRVLEGLKAVRERPGMYIGSSGIKGLHHLIWEIIDNSVDEVLAGYATEICLTIKADQVVSISDNGRGIPVGMNKQTGVSNLITVFTILHAGGKFENNTYKMSGGLHGVGATCVNALSTFFEVKVCRNGKEHLTKFKNGGEIDIEPCIIGHDKGDYTGTTITWQPDFEILEPNDYNIDEIKERLNRLAYLNKKTKFIFKNEIDESEEVFLYEKGIEDWVNLLNAEKTVLHPILTLFNEGSVKNRKKQNHAISLAFAFQYTNGNDTIIYSFCNNIYTINGGTHLETFKDGLLACLRKRAVDAKIVKNPYDIVKSDIMVGLTAIVSVYYANPEYEGQTKGVLSNLEIKPFIREELIAYFDRFLNENPSDAERIIAQVEKEYNLRVKLELTKQTDRQLANEGFLSFAGKLADCTIKNVEFSELYIVEGDSAGGSAKSARNREFQTILPIKGKLMNVEKNNNLHSILNNSEIKSLISAIGCSHSENFDITKLRYNKLVLMTDADVDGSHIRVLLLTFIYKYMTPLLEQGYVYIAQPPLYRASSSKTVKYIFDDRDLKAFKATEKSLSSYEINRFKGLGEMSPHQLWQTTMDPENRTLLRVSVEDIEATQSVFNRLMGEKVQPRKDFIVANYSNTKNLDIQ